METKHPSQSDCHVRIPGEIKVNLEGICHSPQPCSGNLHLIQPGNRIPQASNLICQQYLFGQSHRKPESSL